jgi:hypothetical protein
MIDVEIQGFQSIEKARFRLDGFTAFVGKSNIGKSAIVRAMQCAMTGASGTDFVRHGPGCERVMRGVKKCKCQTTVRIAMPGLTFVWEKGDAINQYQVWKDGAPDPEVYSKIDRGTPDFLLPYFAPIRVGKDQDLIQVSEQWSPIFLLNQGGNTVADVLSDVARLDQINVAMGLSTKDRKAALATRKVREKDVLDLELALEKYNGLDPVVAQASDVEQRYEAIEGAQDKLRRLVGYLDTLRAISIAIKALKAATAPVGPDATALSKTSRRLAKLDNFYQQVAAKAPVVRRLKGIDEVRVPEADPLRAASTRLGGIEGWLDRLRKIKVALTRLNNQDKLPSVERAPLDEAYKKAQLLNGFLGKQTRLQEAHDRLVTELKTTEQEEQKVTATFGELGICPACSQSIDAGHCLHLEGERHG